MKLNGGRFETMISESRGIQFEDVISGMAATSTLQIIVLKYTDTLYPHR